MHDSVYVWHNMMIDKAAISQSCVYPPRSSGDLVYSTVFAKIVFACAVKNVVPLGARAAPSIGRLK